MLTNLNSSTFEWEVILEALKNQKCILFIGPQLYRTEAGQLVEQALYQALDARSNNHPYIRNFYEEDGFFLFKEERFKRRVIRQINTFYEQTFQKTEQLLSQLAAIPFHLIITLNYDEILQRVFRQKGLPFQQDYFAKNRPSGEYIAPSAEHPLIYHLLGKLTDEESLVLTHNDLFDYLHAIFNGKRLHADLKAELAKAHSFIFLGLPFEKWYLQLLFRILSFHSEQFKKLERFASNPSKSVRKKLFEEQFNIEFIPDDAKTFVQELYENCERRDLIRRPEEFAAPADGKQILTKTMDLIKKAETISAMETLESWLRSITPKSLPLLDELALLMNQFNAIEKQVQLGMIDSTHSSHEKNRIIFSLIQLINKTERLNPAL